jgi:hypothetical protein
MLLFLAGSFLRGLLSCGFLFSCHLFFTSIHRMIGKNFAKANYLALFPRGSFVARWPPIVGSSETALQSRLCIAPALRGCPFPKTHGSLWQVHNAFYFFARAEF